MHRLAPFSDADAAATGICKNSRFKLYGARCRPENPGVYEGGLDCALDVISYPCISAEVLFDR